MWQEVPQYLARLAAEDRARREWVAQILGDLDADDPRAGCGWPYAAARFISQQHARETQVKGQEENA